MHINEDALADPTMADITMARARLGDEVQRTPLLGSTRISVDAGTRVRFKCEMFQRGGSHKLRGALNWTKSVGERGPVRGVVTASSGNHGAAMALACRAIGVPAVVVMPEGSNRTKRAAAEAYGAEVVFEGVDGTNRESVADRIAGDRGYLRNTADSVDGIAGLGTLGEELAEIDDVEVIVVPLGLGALLSGIAIAVKALRPGVRVVGVEPATGDDVRRSLDAGRIVPLSRPPETIADGARALAPSPRTFSIIQRLVDDVVTVSDLETRDAMALVWTRLKVVAEPTAALSLAAVLTGRIRGDSICVLSGGNIDAAAIPVAGGEG